MATGRKKIVRGASSRSASGTCTGWRTCWHAPISSALLPGVAQVASELYGILKTRWADLEPMPLYPAFR